jgi:glutamine phosphoribosylpyrophosphate amidotransferase
MVRLSDVQKCGAAEFLVGFRLPLVFPCFYGLDIPLAHELFAATIYIEGSGSTRVDSISYLLLKTMLGAVTG